MRSAVALNGTCFRRAAVRSRERAVAVREAAERVVVMHHGLAVGADLQVDLDAVIAGNGRRGGAPACSR